MYTIALYAAECMIRSRFSERMTHTYVDMLYRMNELTRLNTIYTYMN